MVQLIEGNDRDTDSLLDFEQLLKKVEVPLECNY
jgi:hypothetical protein